MNFKRIMSLILCVILVVSCALPLASCKKNKDKDKDKVNGGGNGIITDGGGQTTPPQSGKTVYTIQVKTVGGMPLTGVMVYVYKGESIAAMPAETDENGIAKFELTTYDGYTVRIDEVPEGYVVKSGDTAEERYPVSANGAVITLASKPLTEGGFKSLYEVGDIMYDFTFTDVNGNDYKLSELLKTKKMVMLNFWYVGCSNCAYEFPYINRAYNNFKDELEILAINDYPTDTVADVKGYPEYLGVDLAMPLIKGGNGQDDLTISNFDSSGWPTTVIIDRYGVVCMIEIGAVLGDSKWQNIFSHFTAEDYEQKLITDASILNPMVKPTVSWTENSANEIAGALNSGDIIVNYHPEENEKDKEYSWPFIVDTFDGTQVVRPSNTGIDNSYSILYAEIQLKPGQAITFDYYSRTQGGYDVMYVLVDGKDIYSISGDSAEDDQGWSTCCTYVDPRPITSSNKDELKNYTVAFAYYKDDADSFEEDTVYLKNLKVIGVEEIDVETYIFRYATTDLNATGDDYNTYAEIVLGSDGYYHVGSEDGPYLLANLLGYTNFDSYKSVSQRLYETYELMINGENMFYRWEVYANAASNSQIYYYTAVTEELKEYLVAYCELFRRELGKAKNENLWLQLCAYYDAYGKDENGNPTKQFENPIKGLTTFAPYDAVMDNTSTPEKETNHVEYNRVIMPRGYLYRFVPTVSGVYRVTSNSIYEVNGWIFSGSSSEWADNEGLRNVVTSYEVGERFSPDLLIDPDGDGVYTHDYVNVSMVAYLEAGKEYFIDIAFYDVYQEGKFTFDIKWVGETFGHFIQASPGPITYIESTTGGMGQQIAGGIDVIFASAVTCTNAICGELVGFTAASDLNNVVCTNCGEKVNKTVNELQAIIAASANDTSKQYAFHLKGYNGTVPSIGMVIYADFYQPTTLFQSQSVQALIIANAFNYTITPEDREALIIIDTIRVDGKNALVAKWKSEGTADPEAKWDTLNLNTVVKDGLDGKYDGTYTEEQKSFADFAINAGMEALRKNWGSDFDKNWSYYQIDDILQNCMKTGIYHNTDNRSDRDIKALSYLEYYENNGKEALKAYWDAEFDSIVPPAEENVTDVSEWRFNYFWNYYKMDDVKNGIFHGIVVNYTGVVEQYAAMMENDGVNNPERQGCVAVTRELADILTTLIDREVFEDVHNGWLKFCYYYDILGV